MINKYNAIALKFPYTGVQQVPPVSRMEDVSFYNARARGIFNHFAQPLIVSLQLRLTDTRAVLT